MYHIGKRVSIIDRNNITGTILSIEEYNKVQFYEIMLDTGSSISTTENNIRPFINYQSPFDLLGQANFQNKSVFSVESVINKMYGNNNDVIATLKSSKTTFLPYQFKPLIKFIKSDNRKILIADEVGLGKTIEAGYILAELSLRGKIGNCLVICKSSLKEKWQTELKEKFGFNFHIQDRKELLKSIKNDVKNGLESVFSIINYDYSKEASDELLGYIEDNEYTFDMLIIDEAHILRNSATIKHKASKRLIKISKNTVLLTATPVMTSLTNLYSLVKIIEPRYDEYSYGNQDFGYSLFMDHISLSRPFIEAINNLNIGVPPKKVINELLQKEIELKISLVDGTYSYSSTITVDERFKSDPLFLSTIKLVEGENLSYHDLALLQKQLSELNSFQDIITRTRKKEIQTDTKKVSRKAIKCPVVFDKIEMNLYNSIIENYEGEPLALVSHKRQATSCLPAYIEKYKLDDEITQQILLNDSKFKEFNKIINEIVITNNKKVIVFSFFKSTLKYLEKRLNANLIGTIKLDGDVAIDERQSYINTFRNNNNIKVLLSSEVGSEGLDMQFCDVLVNYDLPWNPMVVEQRIGRIDRIGQKSEVIEIYNLFITNTIEEQIFERLLGRIQIFKETIGSLEDILSTDEYVFEQNNGQGLEAQIYGRKLSKAALERKIKEVELALETAELMRKEITEKLDDSFINDQFIKDEVSNISKQKRYITSEDIKALLSLLFQARLATLRCDLDSENPYIRWEDGQNSLFEFIVENIPDRKTNPQLYNSYLDFKKKSFKKNRINCTFSQEEAFENKELEFISSTHPIAQAAFAYFKKDKTTKNNAFFFCINSKEVPPNIIENSIYILAKYNLESVKYTMAKAEPEKSLFELQILFSVTENGEFKLMDDEVTNSLLETNIKNWYTDTNLIPTFDECKEFVKKLKPVLMGEFHSKKNTIETDLRNVHISRQNRVVDTEIDFLKRQIEKDAQTLNQTLTEDPENPIKFIYKKRIDEYNDKINLLTDQKAKIKLELHESLQSLSIISIT